MRNLKLVGSKMVVGRGVMVAALRAGDDGDLILWVWKVRKDARHKKFGGYKVEKLISRYKVTIPREVRP